MNRLKSAAGPSEGRGEGRGVERAEARFTSRGRVLGEGSEVEGPWGGRTGNGMLGEGRQREGEAGGRGMGRSTTPRREDGWRARPLSESGQAGTACVPGSGYRYDPLPLPRLHSFRFLFSTPLSFLSSLSSSSSCAFHSHSFSSYFIPPSPSPRHHRPPSFTPAVPSLPLPQSLSHGRRAAE